MGKQFARNRYDEYRYGAIRLVHNEMVEITAKPAPKPTAARRVKVLGEFISDDAIMPLLLKLIDRAKQKLDIASPWITVKEIIDRLKQAQKQGVQVKVFTRQAEEEYEMDIIYDLISNEIDIATDNDLHAKMVIVDQKELFLGSPNLIWKSMDTNLEVGIFTKDATIVADASAYFRKKFLQARMRDAIKFPRQKRRA